MLLKKLIQTYTRLIEELLPRACILCGQASQREQNICALCEFELPSLPQHCQQCAQFIHGNTSLKRCGICLQNPPPFDRTLALFPYEPPILQLVKQLKFGARLTHAQVFAQLMIQRIDSDWYANQALPDLLIPIPLHPLRLRERGFNQALEISRLIARHFSINMDPHSVLRSKHTRPQSDLSARDRQHNIKNAFTTQRYFNDLKIAVFDDVITTGSTINEFCSVLRKNQAGSIDVWCFARRG